MNFTRKERAEIVCSPPAADGTNLHNELAEHVSRPLSTVPEVTSAESTTLHKHSNSAADETNTTENGFVDELEITDGDTVTRPLVTTAGYEVRRTENNPHHVKNYSRSYSMGGDSNISESGSHHGRNKHRHSRRRREWLFESPSVPEYYPHTLDYWTLPRSHEIFRRNLDHMDNVYSTPGGRLFRKTNSRRSNKKPHKHRHMKDMPTGFTPEQYSISKPSDSLRSSLEVFPLSTDTIHMPHRNELKVYFRFSKGILGDGTELDYIQNEEYLIALQSHCRGWLARFAFDRRLEEDMAIRIIQRNSKTVFNPWIRLMMALRPLLKSHRMEEELMFLKSELERYRTLVKMLRFENAEYQAKVANLLHLIEQINTKGAESSVVNGLVHQISEALTKNQEFWQEMAAHNQVLQSAILPRPASYGISDQSPVFPASPMTQLRHDADFYRNQVEMLKEEADEQQHRSSEHFQGQVSVLSNRMEHLQDLLTMESSKVERLSSELEEMNNTIAEARSYERNLEHMVSQLSKQLEQRNKAAMETVTTPNHHTNSETPTPTFENIKAVNESTEDATQQLKAYRQLVVQLRNHLSSDPKAMSVLANTPFQPGDEMDLFLEPSGLPQTTIKPELATQQRFFAQLLSPSPDHRRSYENLSPAKTPIIQEVAELKRQLTTTEYSLKETEERMRNEIEDREAIESENLQLHNRTAALDRQLRCMKDEFEEAINRRDLVHQRQIKELTDQLEEEQRKNSRLLQHNKDLDREVAELRDTSDTEENLMANEWESMKSRLRSDVAHYKRALDILQEEFDNYRQQYDQKEAAQQIAERDDRINQLERSEQQMRMELDVQQVKLQTSTSLLEDAEKRLKQVTRERTSQLHRITQLESERDTAIREAATVSGRASAEKEHVTAKLRENEDLRAERDSLRRELAEVKQSLAGCAAESAAEKRQAQTRLRDLCAHQEARVNDLKSELERTREDMERLQNELQTSKTAETEQKSATQQGRWKINELEDQLSHSLLRISALERDNTDLEAELVRAKADLSASREAANLRKASRTRIADEWLQGSGLCDDTEDDELTKSLVGVGSKIDYGLETFSEDSVSTPVARRKQLNGSFRSSSLYRSNPSIYRSPAHTGRSLSSTDRSIYGRSSVNILEKQDDPLNLIDKSRIGRLTHTNEGSTKSPKTENKPKLKVKIRTTNPNNEGDSDTVEDSEA